ncbi:hypothetical protein Tco_0537563 [Tanacetum coccineum]
MTFMDNGMQIDLWLPEKETRYQQVISSGIDKWQIPSSQASSQRGGSSNSSYRKDDYNRRYNGDDSEDIMRTSAALVNVQLDRKTRNLTNSWRLVSHSMYMEAAFMTHDL